MSIDSKLFHNNNAVLFDLMLNKIIMNKLHHTEFLHFTDTVVHFCSFDLGDAHCSMPC